MYVFRFDFPPIFTGENEIPGLQFVDGNKTKKWFRDDTWKMR